MYSRRWRYVSTLFGQGLRHRFGRIGVIKIPLDCAVLRATEGSFTVDRERLTLAEKVE